MSQLIGNPLSFGGAADFQTKMPPLTMMAECAVAISSKSLVSMTTAGKLTTTLTDAPNPCVGVALEAGAAGQVIKFAVLGPVDDVPVNGTVSAGSVLKMSATTAGRVAASAAPVTGEAVGFAITASASNVADIWFARGWGGIT